MTTWIELKMEVDRQAEDALSQILLAMGSQGIAVHDAEDIQWVKDQDHLVYTGQELANNKKITLVAYFPESTDIEDLECRLDEELDQLLEQALISKRPDIIIEDIHSEDWQESFDNHYEAIQVSRFLRIEPAKKYKQSKSQETLPPVILDPGISFGTGQHPTTILAMLALERVMRGGERVFDVGSGSGVLSITAARLGARSVAACDIDPQAVASTQSNWDLNQLTIPFEAFQNDLVQGIEGSYDLIVANIVADLVAPLIQPCEDLLYDGDYLILSGIINDRKAKVLESIKKSAFEIELEMTMKDWNSYILKRVKSD